MSPNILLSFAVLRAVRPYALVFLQRYGWIALAILACALIALVPVTGKVADYGAGGWLWALFGLCQRIYVDGTSPAGGQSEAGSPPPPAHAAAINAGLMRLLACIAAVLTYFWQEKAEYSFPPIHFAVFVLCVGILSVSLCLFQRGPSRLSMSRALSRTGPPPPRSWTTTSSSGRVRTPARGPAASSAALRRRPDRRLAWTPPPSPPWVSM